MSDNDQKYGLHRGNPDLASMGAITFGPDGILFVADNRAAAVVAIDVADPGEPSAPTPIEVEDLDLRLESLLGIPRTDVVIRGLATHPVAGTVYLSVTRGRGEAALPVLIRVNTTGAVTDVPLIDVAYALVTIDDAPTVENDREDVSLAPWADGAVEREYQGVRFSMATLRLRTSTITDLAWVDGTLLVAGASNEEFSSTLRRIPFPFTGEGESSALEIYHVSHGKYETASPIRTLVPFDGNTSILASYTCTPLVHFPLIDLHPGTVVRGRTVAELGPINQPLDMVSYAHDGREYLLVSNTRHPLLKIPAAPIAAQPALHDPTEPVGVGRQELAHTGVSLLGTLGTDYVVMLQTDVDGRRQLHTYPVSAL